MGTSLQKSRYGFRMLAKSPVLMAAVLTLGSSTPGHAWGRKVHLARKYRPGQKIVYQTKIETHATIRANPPGLESFLPPLPTQMSTRQQATVTVRAIHDDGSVDVENRFDQFELQSNLLERVPESLRESVRQAQQEFSRRIVGQVLTAHYDREGRLLGFEGAEDILQQLDAPLREPLRQVLKVFLQQVGGSDLYPGHDVKPGEEWKRKVAVQPFGQYPFTAEGENTLRYTGKTRYRGVKAGVVDFRFDNVLTPAPGNSDSAMPLAQLKARGVDLDIQIHGKGNGRVLLALDDGRVLQNRATVRETLSTHLKGPLGASLHASGPVSLEIQTETVVEEDELGK